MAKKSSNDEVYRGERWRVMWISEDGKIKEMGSHEQLLKNNGRYKQLYDLQFRIDENRIIN